MSVEGDSQALQQLLLALLPADGTALGNGRLYQTLKAEADGRGLGCGEAQFAAARESLIAAGLAVKGRGRGGSTARSAAEAVADQSRATDARPDFELRGEVVPAELPFDAPRKARAAPRPTGPDPGQPQVLSYRHADRRKNNPEVGLVNADSDPESPRTRWAYDPHLDPALQFDSARAGTERLIDEALASDDPAVMRAALQAVKDRSAPHLQWAGKAERTSFEVDTVSLHVHERVDPMSILAAAAKRSDKGNVKDKGAAKGGIQPGLFDAPFENLPLRDAVDFYRHDKGWSNRLIAGDSLLVMNSLLVKEGLAGQVQMIYIDPPYGIRYGSNFQPFVNKRDVKDRADANLTQEPEMIKAFRDTWELGIHSYLTYLRDRLLLARELLSETGSVCVQIGDENVHLARSLLDEIFGPGNHFSQVAVKKTSAQTSEGLSGALDYVLIYARNIEKLKYRSLFREKELGGLGDEKYQYVLRGDGRVARLSDDQLETKAERAFSIDTLVSQRPPGDFAVEFQGEPIKPRTGYWKTGELGFRRLIHANRVLKGGTVLMYRRFFEDFPAVALANYWEDTSSGASKVDPKVYVVQTATKIVERCLLMTTDPGDLVLDPTCGSGTTAYVAEKWGRRWITCDTSRVAVTLAKTRLMTASFDYFELRYPHEGLKGGFIYKTVPHVTLKSIANNPEIDALYGRHHPAVESALEDLNAALHRHAPAAPFTVTEGVRKGQALKLDTKGVDLLEWEVPIPADDGALPPAWAAECREAFDAFHAARQRLQQAMDQSIATHADTETLVDQPEKARNKLRITGPFSVEAVPFPTVLSLDESQPDAGPEFSADAAVARSGATSRHAQWRDELLKTGIRGRGGQIIRFESLDTLAGTACLHAGGLLTSGEYAVVSFGPEHGALEQRQVEHALQESTSLVPRPKFIVFCAFTFDPEAAKDIDEVRFAGVTLLKAQMNTDLLTEDLKKARSGNQSFWLMGQPDVLLHPLPAGGWQVEVNGFDYFDTASGELVSGGKSRIALWSPDTDYDGRSLFPHQVFFPMAGKGEGCDKLKRDIRAELDESRLKAFEGTKSLPFEAGRHRRVAVKIVDDRGIESLKVMALQAPGE